MNPYYQTDNGKLYCGDSLQLMKELSFEIDLVLTDPPYPDYYEKEYSYNPEVIKYLDKYKCKQYIFWTAKEDFLLDYTAIHIWDKKVGCASEYERIYERNGQQNYKMYRYYVINSSVAANYTGDKFWDHPSQKPYKLIEKILINSKAKKSDCIFDPFAGSGTTPFVCEKLGYKWIAIEMSKIYCDMIVKRIENERVQLKLAFV